MILPQHDTVCVEIEAVIDLELGRLDHLPPWFTLYRTRASSKNLGPTGLDALWFSLSFTIYLINYFETGNPVQYSTL